MCPTAKNLGLQEENINISKPQGKTLIRKTEWVPQKERDSWQKERERGREDAVLYEKEG